MKSTWSIIVIVGVVLFSCITGALIEQREANAKDRCPPVQTAKPAENSPVITPVIATVVTVDPFYGYKQMPQYVEEKGPPPREVKATLYILNPDRCAFFVKLLTDDKGWEMDGGYALKLKMDGGTVSVNTHYNSFNIEISGENVAETFSPAELKQIMKAFEERLTKETKLRDEKRLEAKRLRIERLMKGQGK